MGPAPEVGENHSSVGGATSGAGSGEGRIEGLFGLDACCDGFDDRAGHLELRITVLDVVATCDPREVGVCNPDGPTVVLAH
jgi:hypothetical protein